jgi:hypothetical protein
MSRGAHPLLAPLDAALYIDRVGRQRRNGQGSRGRVLAISRSGQCVVATTAGCAA